jgi:DNA gyrase subunit A
MCRTNPTGRRARGDRAQARRDARGGAEPALPLHADADSFGCNMLALNGGRPEQLTLRDFLTAFIAFREEVVARRTAFELRKARERAHVLCGLAVAVSNVDEVVATIRSSADAAEAREKLMERRWPAEDIALHQADRRPDPHANEDGTYNLSEIQARAILDLRLQRLTAAGRQGGHRRAGRAGRQDQGLPRHPAPAASGSWRSSRRAAEVREKFAVPRRTEITDWSGDMEDEDLIEREDMVVTSPRAATSSARRWPISARRSAAARACRAWR